jgi:hypothetical protein
MTNQIPNFKIPNLVIEILKFDWDLEFGHWDFTVCSQISSIFLALLF